MPLTYKGHTIVAGAAPSHTAPNFIPLAYIAWKFRADRSRSYAMVSDERYSTFEEASTAALSDAKAWVDRHFQHLD
jgi:hypothetical protein